MSVAPEISPFVQEATTGLVGAPSEAPEASAYPLTLQVLEGGKDAQSYHVFPRPRAGNEPFPSYYLEHPALPENWSIRVYHGSHLRNADANRVEVNQMVLLGDKREDSQQEFVEYFDSSFVIELTDMRNPDRLLGMIRIIPYSQEKGEKTVKDIAQILEKDPDVVQAEFMVESGCADMEKVWDISTFALAEDIERSEIMPTIKALLAALVDIGIEEYHEGNLTHVLNAVEPRMLAVLYSLGYPMQDLNGYGDLKYDTKHTGVAMVCHPSHFAVKALEDILRAPTTRHMRVASFALHAF